MANVRDFLDDGFGDFAVVNGDLAFAADEQAIDQGIACRVKMILGEYWLDVSVGVDWLGSILVKNPNLLLVRELLRAAIASTPDVVDVAGVIPILGPNRTARAVYTIRDVFTSSPRTNEVNGP